MPSVPLLMCFSAWTRHKGTSHPPTSQKTRLCLYKILKYLQHKCKANVNYSHHGVSTAGSNGAESEGWPECKCFFICPGVFSCYLAVIIAKNYVFYVVVFRNIPVRICYFKAMWRPRMYEHLGRNPGIDG